MTQESLGIVGLDWHIQTTGDFDGNSTGNILRRNDNGATGLSFMNSGSVTSFTNLDIVGTDWHIAA